MQLDLTAFPRRATAPALDLEKPLQTLPASRVAIGRWLREPLLHFLLIGAALFAVYAQLRARGRRRRGARGRSR